MWRPLLLLLSVAGCLSDFGPAPCTGSDVPFDPGVFVSTGGTWDGPQGTFAHAAVSAKTLFLERRADGQGVVRISYQRAGKTVVETWKVAGPDIRWREKKPPDAVRFFDQSPRDFGRIEVGQSSAPQTFTLFNDSDRAVTPFVEVRGKEFALLGHTCRNLPIDGRCTIEVAFRPQSPYASPVLGGLLVTPPLGATATVTLSGLGTTPPIPPGTPGGPSSEFQLSPTSIDFGTVEVGATARAAVIVTNVGGIPASPLVSVQGEGFASPAALCMGLQAGGRCRVEVLFSPTSPKTFNGTLGVTGPKGIPVSAALIGTAIAARDGGAAPDDAAPPAEDALADAGRD